ncbi:MAG: hypothetical protein ACRERV_09440, partial [Methylococcales bacterium]
DKQLLSSGVGLSDGLGSEWDETSGPTQPQARSNRMNPNLRTGPKDRLQRTRFESTNPTVSKARHPGTRPSKRANFATA